MRNHYNTITCECSLKVREGWLYRHLQSNRHRMEMALLESKKATFNAKKEEVIKREETKKTKPETKKRNNQVKPKSITILSMDLLLK